ncbi:MAG: TonB family protein [Microscillaceae bacterium]|jgi:protein TonB|nr:TonB family protein [Microscillaceae bacterium]
MELKKNPKVDLNRQSGLFFNIGLIVSLVVVLAAFEWKFYDNLTKVELADLSDDFVAMEEIPITEMPPPPPPVLQQPEIVEVPDEEDIKQEIEMNLDVDLKQEVQAASPIINESVAPPAPPVEEEKDEVFLVVEDAPSPKGGMGEFYKYVSQNIEYPKQARKMSVEGKVILQVTIDKDGSLNDIQVLKGIGAGCDEEAIRVMKEAPKWIPGKQRGRPVKVKMTVPIMFRLS